MPERPKRDLAVGSLFALALIILALGVMAVGGESGVFFKKTRYEVVFANADGLLAGAPVRMAGVQIGTVAAIDLPTDPGVSGIRVRLGVDPVYEGRVREDSRAGLRILQLLTNEKFVELTPGSQAVPVLPPGSEIPPLEATELLQRGEAIAENINEITVSLKNILGPLEQGEGVIGQMLQDPEFGLKGLEALRGTLENTQKLTHDLRRGKGTVGRLIYDEKLSARLDDLSNAIESFSAAMQAIGRMDGALGELTLEDGAGKQAVRDAAEAAASLKRIAARLESPEGLTGRLLNDLEYSEAVAADLRATLASIASITGKIDRGEGSLGALVNERVLHDGAEDVFAGVNDSKFARWLLRRYRKKGIKAAEDEAVDGGR